MQPLTSGLIVLAVLLAFIAILLFGGLWLARRLARAVPKSQLSKKLSLVDFASAGVIALSLLLGTVVRQLAPETALGSLLGTPLGLAAAFFVVWVIATALHVTIRIVQKQRSDA